MDLTPYLDSLQGSNLDEVLLSIAVNGKVALAVKGRFFLRCLCDSFNETTLIGCAVTDANSCLGYLRREPYELLICTDFLESGNGFELAREASSLQPALKVVVLALGDAIPVEYSDAPWLEAVVAEADFVEDQKPLEAAVIAVMEPLVPQPLTALGPAALSELPAPHAARIRGAGSAGQRPHGPRNRRATGGQRGDRSHIQQTPAQDPGGEQPGAGDAEGDALRNDPALSQPQRAFSY